MFFTTQSVAICAIALLFGKQVGVEGLSLKLRAHNASTESLLTSSASTPPSPSDSSLGSSFTGSGVSEASSEPDLSKSFQLAFERAVKECAVKDTSVKTIRASMDGDNFPHHEHFKDLREQFEIDDEEFRGEMMLSFDYLTGGVSGSVVRASQNKRYILKDLKKKEEKLLGKLLPKYKAHMKDNPRSFLPRLVCILKLDGKFYMVCEHVERAKSSTALDETRRLIGAFDERRMTMYDLKGNTCENRTGTTVQKDNDLNDQFKFEGFDLMAQLEIDTDFCETHELVDYSLFLRVYSVDNIGSLRSLPEQGVFIGHRLVGAKGGQSTGSEPEPVVVFVGVIDILTEYGLKKKAEFRVRNTGTRDGAILPPAEYRKRMVGEGEREGENSLCQCFTV